MVRASTACQAVIAVPAVGGSVSVPAVEAVVAAQTRQRIVTGVARERIIARVAGLSVSLPAPPSRLWVPGTTPCESSIRSKSLAPARHDDTLHPRGRERAVCPLMLTSRVPALWRWCRRPSRPNAGSLRRSTSAPADDAGASRRSSRASITAGVAAGEGGRRHGRCGDWVGMN